MTLPAILQQATIGVISTDNCASLMAPAGIARVWDNQICLFDSIRHAGACSVGACQYDVMKVDII